MAAGSGGGNKKRAVIRRHKTPEEHEAIVLEIQSLMLRPLDGWSKRAKAALAEKHNVSVYTITEYASEASRRLIGAANSREREQILEEERIAAMTDLSEIASLSVDGRQYQAATNAIRTKAEISGVIQPSTTRVTNVHIDLGGAKFTIGPQQQVALVEACYRFFVDEHPELAVEFQSFIAAALSGPKVIDG